LSSTYARGVGDSGNIVYARKDGNVYKKDSRRSSRLQDENGGRNHGRPSPAAADPPRPARAGRKTDARRSLVGYGLQHSTPGTNLFNPCARGERPPHRTVVGRAGIDRPDADGRHYEGTDGESA